jgi:hypothetical protein
LGAGFSGSAFNKVNSLAVYKNKLYAGGDFKMADTIAAANIAEWGFR